MNIIKEKSIGCTTVLVQENTGTQVKNCKTAQSSWDSHNWVRVSM